VGRQRGCRLAEVVVPAGETTCGHQNQRPSIVAIDDISCARTMKVSTNRPLEIVEPI
jgi:hypothetical protein